MLTPSLLPPLSVQDWLALFSLEENLVAPLLWHAVFDPRRDGHVAFRNLVFGLAWVGRHPVSPCASQGLPPLSWTDGLGRPTSICAKWCTPSSPLPR